MTEGPKRSKLYSVVRAEFLLPISDVGEGRQSRIADGYVLTKGDKILEVGKYSEEIGKRIVKDFGPDLLIVGRKDDCMMDLLPSGLREIPMLRGALLPGFVKCHGHDHESPIIGIAKDVPLTEWLDGAVNVFTGMLNEMQDELVERLGMSPHLLTYLKARIDDLYYGITSCMVHHCNHNKYHVKEIVQANIMAGTKMIVAVGSQDRNYDERILDIPAQLAVDRLDKYVAELGSAERTQIIPGPDQFFSNGPELLKALKAWGKRNNTLVHCHSSEEPNTTRWFTETYGMTPVEYADSIGFLDGDTVLAHQVNNTNHDLEIMAEKGVKIVHNPLANTILGSGMPPLIKMMDMGIKVAISTDGSGSADVQNILGAARNSAGFYRGKHANPRLLPSMKLLEMITAIPAEIMKINAGQLTPGYDADWVLLDTRRPNMTPTHLDNVAENLIWASDGSEVRYTMANGFLVRDDFEFTTLPYDTILDGVTKLAHILVNEYMPKAKKVVGTGAHKE